MRKQFLDKARRIVIKVGTSVIADRRFFDEKLIAKLAKDLLAVLKPRENLQIIIVSSGAIGAGMRLLGLKKRPQDIAKLQAIAAVGQRRLMQLYDDAFKDARLHTAQMLLTWEDLGDRKRYQNTKRTLDELLKLGCLPIINENDTVATEEIQFGDNDQLSAMTAILFNADLLIMLQDSDGLYADFKAGKSSRISLVDDLSASILAAARDLKKTYSKGGMKSKLTAVQKAVDAGIPCLLANGRNGKVFTEIFEGQDLGTLFLPKIRGSSSKKHWIQHISRAEGTLVVDSGAQEAVMRKGKSLLSKGIIHVIGHFDEGSTVLLKSENGKCLGKGIINFSSSDLEKIRGMNSKEWSKALGRPCMDEVLHRDNFVKEKDLVK